MGVAGARDQGGVDVGVGVDPDKEGVGEGGEVAQDTPQTHAVVTAQRQREVVLDHTALRHISQPQGGFDEGPLVDAVQNPLGLVLGGLGDLAVFSNLGAYKQNRALF